jgi:hypothetical protein
LAYDKPGWVMLVSGTLLSISLFLSERSNRKADNE